MSTAVASQFFSQQTCEEKRTARPESNPTVAPLASSRPTAIPDRFLDEGARLDLALRRSAIFEIPVDLMVPVRLDEAPPNELELRSAFLLAHVDNQSSIGQIALYAGLSIDETYSRFLALLSAGIIVFGAIAESTPPPSSCVISRNAAMPDDEDDSL